jgi:hypothetical protein
MFHKYTCLLVGVGLAVILSQPSTVWAQAGPDLAIAMSHSGNFTVGENGVYNIVVTNIGGTATSSASGSIFVADRLRSTPPLFGPAPGFTFVSMTGTGLNCYLYEGQPPSENYVAACFSPFPPPVIAPGGSIPITLTVRPTVSGTVTNVINVNYSDLSGGIPHTSENTASDVTIVVAAVPTLPEWAMIVLTGLLASAGFAAMRRRTT